MNKVDRQAQMMDYLYGEMTDGERREYEHWLTQNPDARQELEAMQTSRQWLAEVEDVNPQPMVVEMPRKRSIAPKWWYRAGIAAAVFLALWLFNFQIRADGGGVILSFGHPESIQSQDQLLPGTADNIPAETMEQLLVANQQLLESKLISLDSSWQNRFAELKNTNRQQWQQVKNVQANQVQQIRQEFIEKELPRFAGLMQQLQINQQEELQLLLVEFWNTWQETRQTDLEQIDYQMTNLYQNVEQQQQASEARVVNYIQQVAGR